jgi:FkbM family methyltransferase
MSEMNHLPLLHRIPMTRIKICIAHILYKILKIFSRGDNHLIQRNGVKYEVDLSEGIDLSLFLFGNFQNHIVHPKYFTVATDAIIFDVGANIGSMAFGFAQLVSQGYVYAFEPTTYAFSKFQRNLSLNPELAKRIMPVQAFLSNCSTMDHKIVAYSSWKVDRRSREAHSLHGGTISQAVSVPATTIDDFCREKTIQRVDLIKVDTDGHEFEVLQGARETLSRYLPFIIFEIALYLLEERGVTFEEYFLYLSSFGYKLINSKNGQSVTVENYMEQIPLRYTTDLFAIPLTKRS